MKKKNGKTCPAKKSVVVSGYRKRNGTYVKRHKRALPNTCSQIERM